ncbi:MalY/PatB family protein [Pseudolactococcus reticulitermitis]|nr:MalY/PatB family protein [Lactococcus reticulitermitis]
MYDFDKVRDRRQTNCRKWSPKMIKEKFHLGQDAIPLDLADIDFECLPEIKEAMLARAEMGEYSYTSVTDDFYEAVIAWNKRRFNLELEKDWIRLTFGTVSTLHYIVQAFTKENESVLINTPAYAPFAEAIENNNRQLCCSPLIRKDNRYDLDFENIEHQMQTKSVKVFIFCSPQNPSGRVWSKVELEKIAELCLKYDVLLVCDEIHRDILFERESFSSIFNAHADIAQNCILCLSPNKAFNLGGLKVSYVAIPNEKIRETLYQQLTKNAITSPHVFAVPAVISAYQHGEQWLDELTAYMQSNFEIFYDFVEKNMPKIKVMEADSSFLAWLDISELFSDEVDMTAFFTQARLTTVPGSYFVQDGEGFVRLNLAITKNMLQEVLNRMRESYEQWERS